MGYVILGILAAFILMFAIISAIFPPRKLNLPYVKEIISNKIITIDRFGDEIVYHYSSEAELLKLIKDFIHKGFYFYRQDDYKIGIRTAAFVLEDLQANGILTEKFNAFHYDNIEEKYFKYQIPQNININEYEIDSVVEIKRFKSSGNDTPFFLFGLTNGTTLTLVGEETLFCKNQTIFPSTKMKISWYKFPYKITQIECSGNKINNMNVIPLQYVTNLDGNTEFGKRHFTIDQKNIHIVTKKLLEEIEKKSEDSIKATQFKG